MKKTFIIASTGDRTDSLIRLIISLTPFIKTGWKMAIVCQKYSSSDLSAIKKLIGHSGDVFSFSELIGAHSAKMVALQGCKSDIWCSLDDDMFAFENTNYDKIADILNTYDNIGFVSSNWARTFELAKKKNIEDKLQPQRLVFTGGGLLFRDDVAEIIRNIPNEKYLFDDCLWAMYAYINGYNNYRYLGSIAVHQICSKGGRRTWIASTKQQDRVLPPETLLKVRKGKSKDGYNQFLICSDSDLTKEAHKLHKENALKIGSGKNS